MNKVYGKLKGKENITEESIKEVSSFKFSDKQIALLLRDLNEN